MFKPIKNYEKLYMIDELGNVKSLPKVKINNKGYKCLTKEKILKPQKRNGYLSVTLSNNKHKQMFSVHRLVAIHFIPNPQDKPYVNHIDGNKFNNNVLNLEWVTGEENMRHSYYVLNKNKKRVKCIDTNTIYPSMKEAERQTGILTGGITHSCRNQTRAGGYLWEYVD